MFDMNPFHSPDVVALFIFNKPLLAQMWMRNTPRALDMIFIRANHTVACVHRNAVPYDERAIRCEEPVLYVVEALAGYVDSKKIGVGDRVMFSSSFTIA